MFPSDHDSALESRIRRLERRLSASQIAVVLLFGLVVYEYHHPVVYAQAETVFKAPLRIVNQQGRDLLRLGEWVRPGSPNIVGPALTLYANGQPAASIVATGDLYRDPKDASQNYLNELKTYLYEYSARPGVAQTAIPQEVSSLALTRSGGSLIIMGRSGTPGVAIPAARLTANREAGGTVILYNKSGQPGTTLRP